MAKLACFLPRTTFNKITVTNRFEIVCSGLFTVDRRQLSALILINCIQDRIADNY